MGALTRFLKALSDKGVDLIFEYLGEGESAKVELPAELRKYEVGAAELLGRSDELLGGTSELGEIGATEMGEEGERVSKGNVDYCLECCDRHLGVIRDALSDVIRWIQVGEREEKIMEKIMDVSEAMNGMEMDLKTVEGEALIHDLHRDARVFRKMYWDMRVGSEPTVEKARTLLKEAEKLQKSVYEVAPKVKGGGFFKYCGEWGASDIGDCVKLMMRAQQIGGYEPVTKEDFEPRFHELTGRKAETNWDEKGRLTKITVK